MPSFILRFDSQRSRDSFCHQLESEPQYQGLRVTASPILPDLIIRDVGNDTLAGLRQLADGKARVIEDFKHDIFAR